MSSIIGYHGATLSANLVTNEAFYGLAPLSEGSAIFVAPQGLDTEGGRSQNSARRAPSDRSQS